VIGKGGTVLISEGRFRLDVRGKFFTEREMRWAQAAHRICGYPIPGAVQDWAG